MKMDLLYSTALPLRQDVLDVHKSLLLARSFEALLDFSGAQGKEK